MRTMFGATMRVTHLAVMLQNPDPVWNPVTSALSGAAAARGNWTRLSPPALRTVLPPGGTELKFTPGGAGA
jgi:hypothetical protein